MEPASLEECAQACIDAGNACGSMQVHLPKLEAGTAGMCFTSPANVDANAGCQFVENPEYTFYSLSNPNMPGVGQCQTCSPGKASTAGGYCVACETGKIVSAAQTECELCPAGTQYTNSSGSGLLMSPALCHPHSTLVLFVCRAFTAALRTPPHHYDTCSLAPCTPACRF